MKSKYLRISPQKIGLVADLIRGCDVNEALRRLRFSPKKGAAVLLKSLNSAVANAKQKGLKPESLRVSEVTVGPAPTLKRLRPRAQGRADRILKRNSHVMIRLREKDI